MKVDVVRPVDLGESELAVWRGFQSTRLAWANPFLSPEFTVAVGRVRPQTRVGVLVDGPAIVGFFPFEQRPLGYGVAVGAGLTDCQGLIHAPGLDWDPQELLRSCHLSVWEFDHLVDGQGPFARYEVLRAPSPIMDLRGGFAAYLAERRGTSVMVRDLPRKRRRLAREVGEVRFELDARDRAALHTVLGWKSAQYQRTGRADRFAHPWIVELLEHLLAERTVHFAGLLSLLHAGDELVAGHVGLRSSRVIPTWFPAYDVGFARHSPGVLLHLALAEAAAEAGIDHVDMGRGPKAYKESLKSRDLIVAEGRVVRRVPAAALHWARRAPVRRLRNVVTDNPALFRIADRILQAGGRIRTGLRRAPEGVR